MKYILKHFVSEPYSLLKIKKADHNQIQNGNSELYRTMFFWLLLLLFILMPLMSLKFGRNSDETVSNNYGKDVLKYLSTFGKDRSVFDLQKPGYKDMLYYGLSFDLLCAVVNKVSPIGEFETRHMLNSLFGLLAIFFAALIARRLMNWRAAVMVLLFMFISPQFLGYSMNNAKDIPFAAGYVAAIYFLLRFLIQLPNPRKITIVFLTLSIGFTCSNKVNGIILLACLILFLVLIEGYKALKNKSIKGEISSIRRFSNYLLFIGIGAYILTIAFWPYSHQSIIKNVWQSLIQFEKIGTLMIHYELFDGDRMNMEFVPWYYTFKLMLITIPIYVLAGFAASLLGIKWISKKINVYLISILLFVTFFPIFYAMYKHSKLYNGWRHFLFIYPTFVVLSVCGWEYLLSLFNKRYLKYALIAIFALMMAKPLLWMINNNPNQVAYFNEFTGGVNGAFAYYETDPLTNCGREAIEWLIKNRDMNSTSVLVGSNIENESLKYYANKFPNKINFQWLRYYNQNDFNWDYAIISIRGMSHSQLTTGGFPPKGTIHVVKVDNIPLCAIIKKQNSLKYDGFQLYNNGQYDKAIPYFEKALVFDSLDEEAMTTLGSCYINIAEFKTGVDYSVRGINMYNENFIAYDNLGVAEFFSKNYDKAITNYKKSLSYRINWKSPILNLAKTYFFLKNYDSAIWYFNMGNKYFPNDVEIYQNMAEIYKAMNENELALQLFENILKITPNDHNAKRNIEWLKKTMSNQALNEDIEKAKYYSSQNKHDSAIICLNLLLTKDSSNVDALLNRGVAYYLTHQYKKAIADFDHILLLDPNQPEAWLKKAQVLNVMEKKAKVEEYLNKALELNPQNAEVLNERGHYYFSVKDFGKAFKDYSSSLALYPNQPIILYSRAYTYSMQKQYNEAFPDVNEALRLDPNFADAYMFRAMLYFETRRYPESLVEVEKAKAAGLKVDPQFESNLQNQIRIKSKQ